MDGSVQLSDLLQQALMYQASLRILNSHAETANMESSLLFLRNSAEPFLGLVSIDAGNAAR